jgi:hypothetical protein
MRILTPHDPSKLERVTEKQMDFSRTPGVHRLDGDNRP